MRKMRRLHNSSIPLLLVLLLLVVSGPYFVAAKDLDGTEACMIENYYQSVRTIVNSNSSTLPTDRTRLQHLLERTHRQTLPYTSTDQDDVWKALQEIDRGLDVVWREDTTDTTGTITRTIKLVYSNTAIPSEPKGTPETWNREHVWPKSYGVGYTANAANPAYTDVHHLYPAAWTMNSLRSNRYFDTCTTTSTTRCKVSEHEPEKEGTSMSSYTDDPAVYSSSSSSSSSSSTNPPRPPIFQPPANVRGDIARALLYMDLRYDHLELTDCPETNTETTPKHQMAYLSTLLAWHHQDPVSPDERHRNERICARWQGNRNPYVDYPHLVHHVFPSSYDEDRRSDEEHHAPPPLRPQSPCENSSTQSSSTTRPPHNTGNHDDDADGYGSSTVAAGDVMIIGIQSDDPDSVTLVALTDLHTGLVLHITDNAYYGDTNINTTNDHRFFASNEGIMSLTVPETIRAGTIFGYTAANIDIEDADTDDSARLLYGNSWTNENDKGFQLSTSGDTVIVYATTPTVEDDVHHNPQNAIDSTIIFLSAISFAGGKFVPDGNCYDRNKSTPSSALTASWSCGGTKYSALPKSIEQYTIHLNRKDNYLYTGPTNNVTKSSLQNYLSIGPVDDYWKGSNTKIDIPTIPTELLLNNGNEKDRDYHFNIVFGSN